MYEEPPEEPGTVPECVTRHLVGTLDRLGEPIRICTYYDSRLQISVIIDLTVPLAPRTWPGFRRLAREHPGHPPPGRAVLEESLN